MQGFKATDKNGKCRDVQFEVGKTYTVNKPLEMCKNGFHFCEKLLDVYNYYEKTEHTRIFLIEALGEVITEKDKSVTNSIKIIRELTDRELLIEWIKKTNSGYWNSGNSNSGNSNSGYWNSGDGNSGNSNSGYWNSGNSNSGDGNSGNSNSGYWNSGDRNSGYGNSGYGNSGYWNSGDRNSGYFNTETHVYFFNKPSNIKYSKDLENKLRTINVKPILTWITSDKMTSEEQSKHPSHKVTRGFLRSTGRHDWSKLTDSDKQLILGLPNYDDNVFEKISGIRLLSPKTIKITVNGVEKEIDIDAAKKLGLI